MRGRNPSTVQGRDRRRAVGPPVLDELESPGSAASDKSRGLGPSPISKTAQPPYLLSSAGMRSGQRI
jgi:hypothetical protein